METLMGMYLDEHLTLNHYDNYLCNNPLRSMRCISQAKTILARQDLKSLYYALVQSHLTYCPIILSIINTKNEKQTELIQKKQSGS